MSTPPPLPLLSDLRDRWRRGEAVRVEYYLERHAPLHADTEQLLDLIYQEVVLREEAGETPRLDEYLGRFAGLERELRPIFEVHDAVRSSAPGATAAFPELREEPAVPAVPGYEILGVLGRGGMGVVYQARQEALGRVVALKMLHPGACASAAQAARFRTEAVLAARLRHPNIVPVYEVGTAEGRPFFVMEYVEGGSLAAHLDGAPRPPAEAARLVATLARAAHHAHQNGVVHRDLKPANVLLAFNRDTPGNSAVPRITDFGLAKDLDSDAGASRSGDILGTPSYMAPEQALGRARDAGPPADVYALGAILYECLTGRPPFKATTPVETLREVLEDDPLPPARLRPRTPRDLQTITLKCLHKDPRRRYASAAELADDLERFLDGRPILARPVGAGERVAKLCRRRPAAAALAGVVVLASAAFALTWWRVSARERERLGDARAEVRKQLDAGRRALTRGDWSEARSRAAAAVTRLDAEPGLADLRPGADELHVEADRRLSAAAAGRAADADWEEFGRRRDAAFFHGLNALSRGALLTGLDADAHAARAEEAGRAALALAGVPLDADGEWSPAGRFAEPTRRPEAAADCYALLLVLADAVADRDPRAALRLVGRAGRLLPPTRAYHVRRAEYLEALGDTAGASRERGLATEVVPAGSLDHFLDGQAAFRRGDVRGAAASFLGAVADRPDHFWANCSFAVCCLHEPERRWGEARAALTVCLAARPDFVWPWLLRGYAHRSLGAFAAAASDFRRAEGLLAREPNEEARYVLLVNRAVLGLDEESSARRPEGAALVGVLAAPGGLLNSVTALAAGARDLTGPAADLHEASRLRPRRYEPHLNLVDVYQREGREKEAERAYHAAERLGAPPAVLAATLVARARRQLDQGHYAAAADSCAAALRRAGDLGALDLLARALVFLKRDEEAVRALDQYLGRDPAGTPDVYRGRGLALLRLGRLAEAADDLGHALALRPDAELYLQRGWAHFFLDSWQLARRDFDAAIRLGPAHSDAYAGRGLTLAMLGDYRAAVVDAAAARRLSPASPETHHNLACVYALAAARVEADAPEKDRGSLAAGYRAEALADTARALGAVSAGERRSFWRDKVFPDRALDAVRATPEFRRWQAEYGPTPPP